MLFTKDYLFSGWLRPPRYIQYIFTWNPKAQPLSNGWNCWFPTNHFPSKGLVHSFFQQPSQKVQSRPNGLPIGSRSGIQLWGHRYPARSATLTAGRRFRCSGWGVVVVWWWWFWIFFFGEGVKIEIYILVSKNIAGWKTDPDGRCISYWKMVIFQPAMLVYQRVYPPWN